MADLIQLISSNSRFLRLPLRAGGLGLFVGLTSACVLTIGDSSWGGDSIGECYEEYGDCMDDIEGPADMEACELLLDGCLEACDREHGGGDTGDGGDSGDGDGDPQPGDDGGGGDGDGDAGGDGDGEPDGPDPACFEIHAACIEVAQTIQDVEACNALFDNCVDPAPCEGCEEPGCPQAELDACVSQYAGCASEAMTAEDVLVCEGMFDVCIGQFDVELCLPNYDDALVGLCLEQHELCVACADGPEEIAACKTTFDNCLQG